MEWLSRIKKLVRVAALRCIYLQNRFSSCEFRNSYSRGQSLYVGILQMLFYG